MKSLPRLAVVAGVRTPFAKAFGTLAAVPAVALGVHAVQGLFRSAADRGFSAGGDSAGGDSAAGVGQAIDEVVLGNVAGPADAANVARVVALRSGIPEDRIAHTVHRNCGSGMEAIVEAWHAVTLQRATVVIAGGTESMSGVPLLVRESGKAWFTRLARSKTLAARLRTVTAWRPGMLQPIPGLRLGLTDPVCGLSMGETAEALAKEFSVDRAAQDAFALASHQRASKAQQECFLSGEIHPWNRDGVTLEQDNGPRPGQSLEQLTKLRPIFADDGTVTAGNSCSLTDGAAAVLVMSETEARRRGLEPLGFVHSYAIAGCQPQRMGLGPVYAIARLLRETGSQLSDFDLFEINEAFAAQVLACGRAAESKRFAAEELDRSDALGVIPPEQLNVHGGSIALGHPVGTTGTRLVITLLRALREKGFQRGIASLCIGGGQGMAMAVEVS